MVFYINIITIINIINKEIFFISGYFLKSSCSFFSPETHLSLFISDNNFIYITCQQVFLIIDNFITEIKSTTLKIN